MSEFSAWLLHADRTRALVTESGPDGRAGFVTIDDRGCPASPTWLTATGWTPVGWAGQDAGVLWRRVDGRAELAVADAGGLDVHRIVGRPFAARAGEVLVAVTATAGTVLCRHHPGTDDYQLLDATTGVRSVAGWHPGSGLLVVSTGSTVRVVAYDSGGSEELPVDWPPGYRAVDAVGDGEVLGLTGVDDEGRTVPGMLDPRTRTARWFPSHAGSSCADVAASGAHLLLVEWQDHAYRYRAITTEGDPAGDLRPTDGLATDLRFAADPTHVLGWFQSPARPPAITGWDLRTGQERRSGAVPAAGIRWRHREFRGLPEWVFEPERDAHGGVVVYLHGGPRSKLNQVHEPVIAALVADGWTVIGLNYPGSTGYGAAYRDATAGAWGGVDVAAVQARIRALRGADRAVCLYGISYGGYLALRAAEEADAVAVWAPVTDLPLLVESATGARRRWLETELAELVRTPGLLADRSPAHRPAALAGSRLLVGHGAVDDRVPVAQSHRLVGVLGSAVRYVEDARGTHAPSDWGRWAGEVVNHLRSRTVASLTGRRAS